MLIIYAVCLPLGYFKAIKHNTWFDNSTSVLIFMGYAIPGYVLGFLLILLFAVKLGWFPSGGFTSINFDDLSAAEKVKDVLHHSVLPLGAYLVGGFAFVTMLMKNHLMDNLAADYMRTALSKGVAYRDAVRRHALRNSLIPIATNLGHQVMLFVTGSFLIEKIFDINGFGLLGFNAIIDRDFPVVMGVLMLSAFLMLLGNIISDVLMAMVDPRVRFD
jgi:microcin C transport system permease protein